MTNLEHLLSRTRPIVDEVADFIQKQLGEVASEQVEAKELNSLVSYVDRTAEERLVAGLSELVPGAAFLTEEETVEQTNAEYRWIIDPLDGTTNFLHQVPCFAVSVALEWKGEIVLGIVHEVSRGEQFYAWKNGGAWMNGKRIHVSKTADLKDSLVATGFPYRDFGQMEKYLDIFRFFMKNTRGIRRFGAAAVDLAWVACGRFEVFFEYGLSPWDVAAGILLVKEAGGEISDFHRGEDYLFGEELIAAGPNVMAAAQGEISKAFG
jgi:myo-inositol-1(or 4)-monophosphatase